jgi:signal transduction histidine kinase
MPTPAQVALLAESQRADQLHQLLIQSGLALGIMALVSLVAGWLLAGRVLRPLRTIANAAREISANDLHRRLALAGPRDELRELGDTFDALLARLERAFQAQRQFIANASHELRTPLTLERALLEVALADPDADAASLRRACEQVLASAGQQERLIEALLTLARSQRGLDRVEPVDLACVAEAAVAAAEGDAAVRAIRIDAVLGPAPAEGDSRLVERLAANLVDNAVRHNVDGGRVEVVTGMRGARATLHVANDGPELAPHEVARLLEPFARGAGEREAGDGGLGLGLSIVAAIAEAHGGVLDVQPRAGGGLRVEVQLPVAAVRSPQTSGDRTAVAA